MGFAALYIHGAGGRNRTDMGLLPLDFESSASTSFTTPAFWEWIKSNTVTASLLSREFKAIALQLAISGRLN